MPVPVSPRRSTSTLLLLLPPLPCAITDFYFRWVLKQLLKVFGGIYLQEIESRWLGTNLGATVFVRNSFRRLFYTDMLGEAAAYKYSSEQALATFRSLANGIHYKWHVWISLFQVRRIVWLIEWLTIHYQIIHQRFILWISQPLCEMKENGRGIQ